MRWPDSAPAGMTLYLQFFVRDADAVLGFSASNALEAVSQ